MKRAAVLSLLPLCACWLACAAAPLRAAERILGYEVDVEVRADAGLEVTEHITVAAEGGQIRRGIYRDFPTRYKDRYGNRVVVDFEPLEVLRDGRAEPWFTERKANGVRLNTGSDALLPAPATHTYTLRYRTHRQMGFFDGHDELYWNAIGTGWVFPVERARVQVRLPAPVPVSALRAEAYTGAQGARGADYRASLPAPGLAQWELTRPLAPYEGFTVVLSFPKGVVPAPTRIQRAGWLLRDNRGVLVALAGALGLLAFCLHRWRKVGRDPAPGVVVVRYEPPAGHSPAGLRYLLRMGYDARCFSADLLDLAVAGGLRIEREKSLLKSAWTLERVDDGAAAQPEQRPLLDKLFPGGPGRLALHNRNAATVSAAQAAHRSALARRYQPAMFRYNGGSILAAVGIAGFSLIAAIAVGGGTGLLPVFVLALLMLAVIVAFAFAVKAPTPEGRRLMDEVEGLKRYLGVAERDELKGLAGPGGPPPLDARRYEALLPYAVALEVEDAWTRQFTAAAGAAAVAAATAGMAWYHGGRIGDVGQFTRAIGSGLSAQIASSAHAPGSSSGGGGGGFSGGGGGGGGGGGR